MRIRYLLSGLATTLLCVLSLSFTSSSTSASDPPDFSKKLSAEQVLDLGFTSAGVEKSVHPEDTEYVRAFLDYYYPEFFPPTAYSEHTGNTYVLKNIKTASGRFIFYYGFPGDDIFGGARALLEEARARPSEYPSDTLSDDKARVPSSNGTPRLEPRYWGLNGELAPISNEEYPNDAVIATSAIPVKERFEGNYMRKNPYYSVQERSTDGSNVLLPKITRANTSYVPPRVKFNLTNVIADWPSLQKKREHWAKLIDDPTTKKDYGGSMEEGDWEYIMRTKPWQDISSRMLVIMPPSPFTEGLFETWSYVNYGSGYRHYYKTFYLKKDETDLMVINKGLAPTVAFLGALAGVIVDPNAIKPDIDGRNVKVSFTYRSMQGLSTGINTNLIWAFKPLNPNYKIPGRCTNGEDEVDPDDSNACPFGYISDPDYETEPSEADGWKFYEDTDDDPVNPDDGGVYYYKTTKVATSVAPGIPHTESIELPKEFFTSSTPGKLYIGWNMHSDINPSSPGEFLLNPINIRDEVFYENNWTSLSTSPLNGFDFELTSDSLSFDTVENRLNLNYSYEGDDLTTGLPRGSNKPVTINSRVTVKDPSGNELVSYDLWNNAGTEISEGNYDVDLGDIGVAPSTQYDLKITVSTLIDGDYKHLEKNSGNNTDTITITIPKLDVEGDICTRTGRSEAITYGNEHCPDDDPCHCHYSSVYRNHMTQVEVEKMTVGSTWSYDFATHEWARARNIPLSDASDDDVHAKFGENLRQVMRSGHGVSTRGYIALKAHIEGTGGSSASAKSDSVSRMNAFVDEIKTGTIFESLTASTKTANPSLASVSTEFLNHEGVKEMKMIVDTATPVVAPVEQIETYSVGSYGDGDCPIVYKARTDAVIIIPVKLEPVTKVKIPGTKGDQYVQLKQPENRYYSSVQLADGVYGFNYKSKLKYDSVDGGTFGSVGTQYCYSDIDIIGIKGSMFDDIHSSGGGKGNGSGQDGQGSESTWDY